MSAPVSCVAPPPVAAEDVLTEFLAVMREWNFRPWREAEVPMPSVEQAELVLLWTPYACRRH